MKLLAYIGSWIGISGFIWVLFERADKVAKQEARDSISRFLCSLEVGQSINQWKNPFCLIFDTLFGERQLSWKCFWRSAIASFFAVILVSIIFFIVRFDYSSELLSAPDNIPVVLVILLCGSAILNFFVDYLSLIETRWILNKFGHEPNLIQTISLLVLDLVITFSIYSCCVLLIGSIILKIIGEELSVMEFLLLYITSLKNNIFFEGPPPAEMGIFFYSTFATSIWVWLYVLASLAIVCLSKIHRPWLWLRDNFLDLESQPILAIGWIASLVMTIIFLVSIPFVIF